MRRIFLLRNVLKIFLLDRMQAVRKVQTAKHEFDSEAQRIGDTFQEWPCLHQHLINSAKTCTAPSALPGDASRMTWQLKVRQRLLRAGAVTRVSIQRYHRIKASS